MNEEIHFSLLRSAVATGKLQWRRHALERMMERGITREQVRLALVNGEVIEVYPGDKPYQSCLVLHVEGRALHVVAAFDPDSGICHVITTYWPDLNHFESDSRTRRQL